ncbi:MAG: hypothetical protein JXA93_01140 [Anaerolineae bacterium]|nr:hypothetical protein [Anaerolineae bacterium]
MVAEIRVGYFLEDVAQEAFVVGLVERIADEIDLLGHSLTHDTRSATGGLGTVMSNLRRFLRDVHRENDRAFDALVVALDANCHGYQDRRNEIAHVVEQVHYPGLYACAIPDPHMERWYLADPQALEQTISAAISVEVLSYKCERGRYKNALRQAFRQAGIMAPLGGAEYGQDIAAHIDLYAVGKVDAGFRHFADEIRSALALCARAGRDADVTPSR